MLKKDSSQDVQYRVPPVLWIVLGALLALVVVMFQKNLNGGKGILGENAVVPTTAVVNQQPTAPTFRAFDFKKDVGSITPLGEKDAKVKLVIYSDFECPYCGALVGNNEQVMSSLKTNIPGWVAAFPKIKEEYIDTGKAVIYFRDFIAHQNSSLMHNAARCADDQGKFWEFHDELFALQDGEGIGTDPKAKMNELASKVELDEEKFTSCLDSNKFQKQIDADMTSAQELGVRGTPHVFINSQFISGADGFAAFKKIIDSELSNK